MYVCYCAGVNDAAVKAAIAAGARTLEDLDHLCGAGGECEGCHPELEELLATFDPHLVGTR